MLTESSPHSVVNRAFVASTEPVDEEEGAGLSWADGYIIKA